VEADAAGAGGPPREADLGALSRLRLRVALELPLSPVVGEAEVAQYSAICTFLLQARASLLT